MPDFVTSLNSSYHVADHVPFGAGQPQKKGIVKSIKSVKGVS